MKTNVQKSVWTTLIVAYVLELLTKPLDRMSSNHRTAELQDYL